MMQINNPLQINDWEIEKFLKVVVAIQLTLWGVIGLDAIGLKIPILREFIGFFYLTFVPGIIILRILKLHKLGNIETLLYTVGLSIATLMFTGLVMNTVYPLFGISGPISITPFIITISVVVFILCVLSYVRDKDFSDPGFIDVGTVLSPPALFLCLVPFLAIFGTYLMNFYGDNILQMILIIIIALVTLLIGLDKFIPKKLYPLAVFVIAISLMFHRSLMSMYLYGCDIQYEHYVSNLVKINSLWDPTMSGNLNAMLSLTMLAPIYSIVSNMDINWVFKIIYPLLYSFVPLGLYRVFQKQTDDKIAFLACFFFMAMNAYGGLYALARQEIAELLLVLLVLLMISKDMAKIKRAFLFIIFGISLTVSHYATSYLYMLCLIPAWLMLILADNPLIQRWGDNLYSKFSKYKNKVSASNLFASIAENRTISSTFVLLFITFTLTWYMHVSSSSAFNTIVGIGDHIASSISTDFLNPEAAEGLRLITGPRAHSLLNRINQTIIYGNQIFIIVGAIALLLKHREMKFEREYSAFSIINLGICFAGVSVPFFASSLNMDRLYHFTLIFLAPVCVIGGITVLRVMSKVVRVTWTNKSVRTSLKLLSVYFVIFLLFQTQFVLEVTEPPSGSMSLDETRKRSFYTDHEVSGVKWLDGVKGNTPIYADYSRGLLLKTRIKWGQVNIFPVNINRIPKNSYICFGTQNILEHNLTFIQRNPDNIIVYNLEYVVDGRNKIYANGGSEIYK